VPKCGLASAILLFLIVGVAVAQEEQRFVLLPSSEVAELAGMYPKKGPEKIDGSWQPAKSQTEALEHNLPHISDLRGFGAPNGERIEHPELYYRQYLAVIRGGRALVYVSAFCDLRDFSYWHSHLVTVMDGGSCFWQAWYDPATEKFLSLSINGRA
jgi:hypothetical protein